MHNQYLYFNKKVSKSKNVFVQYIKILSKTHSSENEHNVQKQ